jgi:hypothetical protein
VSGRRPISAPPQAALAALVLATALLAATPTGAAARVRPHIHSIRCAPTPVVPCPKGVRTVRRGGKIKLAGPHLIAGARVVFPRRPSAGRRVKPTARISHTKRGLIAKVPLTAGSGRVYVVRAGVRSNTARLRVLAAASVRVPAAPQALPSGAVAPAFTGQGMWIWELNKSSGGSLDAIAAQAAASGVTTVFLKSSDGGTGALWPQFSPAIVQGLKARGLHVCAWQFVYGDHPDGEAALGAQAVANGAECLVADVEDQYGGKYVAAQTYLTDLRAAIGPDFPLGLTSFPYVDYHPSVPFSVFLGPGAAQANLPQMYWKSIGVSVDTVYQHAYAHNLLYGRPILPLGQTYDSPPSGDIVRFRELASAFGAAGLSWWSWQSTSSSGWSALATPFAPVPPAAAPPPPTLQQGAKGDEVIWLQEHLAADPASAAVPINGVYDSSTIAAVQAFQSEHALPITGQADPATWATALSLPPVAVTWTTGSNGAVAQRASAARSRRHRTLPQPRWSHLRSRDEFRTPPPGSHG